MDTQTTTPRLTLVKGLTLAPFPQVLTIHCTRMGCDYAVTDFEGRAVRTLAHHLVHAHMQAPTAQEIA